MNKKLKKTYFNRELSWLSFNQRVLDQALNDAHPLLERVKFLAISASNLDEFFMVRVGGLAMIESSNANKVDIVGWTPVQQFDQIRKKVREMYQMQADCLREQLEPQLKMKGIERVTASDLTESEKAQLSVQFKSETLSSIAPIAVEADDSFPMLAGARLCMCVRLKNESNLLLSAIEENDSIEQAANRKTDRFVIIPFSRSIPRFWTLPSDSGYRYLLFEDVLALFLSEIFGEQEVLETTIFRITRNGDVAVDEDGRVDLLSGMREMLEARRTSECIRLEISEAAGSKIKGFLQTAIGVRNKDTYLIFGPLGLGNFFSLYGIPGFKELKDKPWEPQESPDFAEERSIFDVISEKDRMLYHPFQQYDPVVQLLETAASDPDVIAIKQTLYRTSSDSKIVKALELAAENGKHVTVIVELKARFDEARNIYWARHMEEAGVDVIYGVRGLKTHAKMCLVIRKEPTGIRRYMHFGTGNYNESTARLYSDVSLFTCDEQLGVDAVQFFNAITGLSVPQTMGKIAAAPINLRETFLELIQLETANAARGGVGQIIAKVNSLVDQEIIDALYDASQAGVKVRLNVRGICCLVPGKKGLSENIRVVSVVDRLLEHARVFCFHHAGDERVFISSADWMGRNLDRRVELLVPVEDREIKSRLLKITKLYFEDNVAASELQPDGTYVPVIRKKKKGRVRSQEVIFEEACKILSARTNPKTTVFEPHRGR